MLSNGINSEHLVINSAALTQKPFRINERMFNLTKNNTFQKKQEEVTWMLKKSLPVLSGYSQSACL